MNRKRTGLTLIEVLVATAILAVATTSVSVLRSRSLRMLQASEAKMKATLHAQSLFAEMNAGTVPVEERTAAPFVAGWSIDVQVNEGPVDGTNAVTLVIEPDGSGVPIGGPVSITRVIRVQE